MDNSLLDLHTCHVTHTLYTLIQRLDNEEKKNLSIKSKWLLCSRLCFSITFACNKEEFAQTQNFSNTARTFRENQCLSMGHTIYNTHVTYRYHILRKIFIDQTFWALTLLLWVLLIRTKLTSTFWLHAHYIENDSDLTVSFFGAFKF